MKVQRLTVQLGEGVSEKSHGSFPSLNYKLKLYKGKKVQIFDPNS